MSISNAQSLISLLDLPPEVIEHCISISSSCSLLSLSLVSHFFNSLAIRSLYRNVSVNSLRALIICCRTLAARPSAASAVRSFSLHYPSTNQFYLCNFYNLILRAFHAIPELRRLKISAPDPQLVHILQHCTFPSLQHFECELTISSPLVHFLERHISISFLQVSPFENTAIPTLSLPSVTIPALEYFSGNAQILAKLGRQMRLRAAFVSWNAMDQQPELALQQLNDQHLRVLSCRRRGWNVDLFDLVSDFLPSVLSLNMTNLLVMNSRPTKEYLNTVKAYLSRFNHLRRLTLQCIDTWQTTEVECILDDDFETVKAWGDACPSLQEIVLPYSGMMTWHRAVDGIWIPDPQDRRGAHWLHDAVVARRYPTWSRVVEAMKYRIASTLPDLTHSDDAPTLVRNLDSPATVASAATASSTDRMGTIESDALSNGASTQSGSRVACRDSSPRIPPSSSRSPAGAVSASAIGQTRASSDRRTGKAHRSYVEL